MFPQQPRGDEGKVPVEISPEFIQLWTKQINCVLISGQEYWHMGKAIKIIT